MRMKSSCEGRGRIARSFRLLAPAVLRLVSTPGIERLCTYYTYRGLVLIRSTSGKIETYQDMQEHLSQGGSYIRGVGALMQEHV